MLEEIKKDLADNFKKGDEPILEDYLEEATTDALFLSNRKDTKENKELLSSEIKQYVKEKYLQRGAEGSSSFSTSGKSTSFTNPKENMRISIVKSGKRLPLL